MKATCDREALREGLAVINSVIPTKSTSRSSRTSASSRPTIISSFVGTDQEVSVRFKIDRQVVEPGPVVVPPARLDFVRDLSGETVTIATGDSQCTITSGADSCDLVIADATEYPVVPRFDDTGATTIQGGNFTRLVGRTAFAPPRSRAATPCTASSPAQGRQAAAGRHGRRRLSMASIPVEMSGVDPAVPSSPRRACSCSAA